MQIKVCKYRNMLKYINRQKQKYECSESQENEVSFPSTELQ